MATILTAELVILAVAVLVLVVLGIKDAVERSKREAFKAGFNKANYLAWQKSGEEHPPLFWEV